MRFLFYDLVKVCFSLSVISFSLIKKLSKIHQFFAFLVSRCSCQSGHTIYFVNFAIQLMSFILILIHHVVKHVERSYLHLV